MTPTRTLCTWAAGLMMVAGSCSSNNTEPVAGSGGNTGLGTGGSQVNGGTVGGNGGAGARNGTGGAPASGGSPGASGGRTPGSGGAPTNDASIGAGGATNPAGSGTGGRPPGTGGVNPGGGAGLDGGPANGTGGVAKDGGSSTGSGGNAGGAGGSSPGGTDWRAPGNAPVNSAGCGKAATVKAGTQTINSAGQSREFIVALPTDYRNTKAYKLLFGFHWMGGTDTNVATGNTVAPANSWLYYGQQRLDTKHDFIFVAPQGIGNGWPNTNDQDVTFVKDMIKLFEDGLCIDTSRIFSVGFSYGGMMGNTITCEMADVFRAVASQSGAGGCSSTQKPIAFFGAGGTESRDSVLATARRIAKANGCGDPNQSVPYPTAGSLLHTCTQFAGCPAAYPVRVCPFDQNHKAAPYDGGCTNCDDGLKSWLPGEDWQFFTQF